MSVFSQTPIAAVADYWNRRPCNIRHSPEPVGTRAYFDQVRDRKYRIEPHIPGFADFPAWAGKRVLEVGCGIGTDTMSFAQAGADVTAVDLSEASIELAQRRASVYGMSDRVRFVQGDAEGLSDLVGDDGFDLVYSFGVIHHTPNPRAVLAQARRIIRPGGTLKVMVYHRYATKVLGILASRGFKIWDIDRLIAEQSEAQTGCPVTYSYTRDSARDLIESAGFTAESVSIDHIFPYRIKEYVKYQYRKRMPWRMVPASVFRAVERRFGWHVLVTAKAPS
ncbi:MAG: class I SAM-dependent methyltransferase [Planctomycetota bacterium]